MAQETVDRIPEDSSPGGSLSLEFKGQAYQTLLQLRSLMKDVKSETDVIIRALALISRAKKKEIQILDPNTGDIEIVNLWK